MSTRTAPTEPEWRRARHREKRDEMKQRDSDEMRAARARVRRAGDKLTKAREALRAAIDEHRDANNALAEVARREQNR